MKPFLKFKVETGIILLGWVWWFCGFQREPYLNINSLGRQNNMTNRFFSFSQAFKGQTSRPSSGGLHPLLLAWPAAYSPGPTASPARSLSPAYTDTMC